MALPENSQIHPIVHVSQLKRMLGDGEITDSRLPTVTEEERPTFWPVRAIDYRQVKKSGRFRWEVLIEWESLPLSEAIWENVEAMKEQFLELDLEDKDVRQGERNDANEARDLKNTYNRARWTQKKVASQQNNTGPNINSIGPSSRE